MSQKKTYKKKGDDLIPPIQQNNELLEYRTALAWIGLNFSIWGHTLRGNTITIRDCSELIKRELQEKEPNLIDINNFLDTIINISNTNLKTPTLSPITDDKNELINLNSFIEKQIVNYQSYHPDVLFICHLGCKNGDTILAKSDWIREGLGLIISNALESLKDSTRKTITITTKSHENTCSITITDTGKGIPENILPKLLIEPVARNIDSGGFGFGLLMARLIIETFNGELTLDETSSDGTTFTISFPKTIN